MARSVTPRGTSKQDYCTPNKTHMYTCSHVLHDARRRQLVMYILHKTILHVYHSVQQYTVRSQTALSSCEKGSLFGGLISSPNTNAVLYLVRNKGSVFRPNILRNGQGFGCKLVHTYGVDRGESIDRNGRETLFAHCPSAVAKARWRSRCAVDTTEELDKEGVGIPGTSQDTQISYESKKKR